MFNVLILDGSRCRFKLTLSFLPCQNQEPLAAGAAPSLAKSTQNIWSNDSPPESSTHFPTQTIHLHQVFFVTRLFLPLHVYGSQISALIKYRIDLHPDLHFFTLVFSSTYFRTTLITHQIIFIKSLHLVFLLLPLASLITHPSSDLTHYTPHITHITHITPRTTQYPASPWFAWLALQTSLSSPFLQA